MKVTKGISKTQNARHKRKLTARIIEIFQNKKNLTENSEEIKNEKSRMVREAFFSRYISSEGYLESVETLGKAAYLSQSFDSQIAT